MLGLGFMFFGYLKFRLGFGTKHLRVLGVRIPGRAALHKVDVEIMI